MQHKKTVTMYNIINVST